MHTPSSTWQITISCPQGLIVGLYVRDVSGMCPHLDIPGLSPPVPVQEQAPSAAAEQWQAWWSQAYENAASPLFAASADGKWADLRRYVDRHRDDALRYSNSRRREHSHFLLQSGRGLVEQDLVQEHQRQSQAQTGHRHLEIIALPLSGLFFRRVRDDRVIISQRLLEDRGEYLRRMRPVVDRLMGRA